MTPARHDATHWIDHMPALPLAEDMPIRNKTNPTRSAIVLERTGDNWRAWFHDTQAVGIVGHAWTDSRWVLDLDSPAGFALALREAVNRGAAPGSYPVFSFTRGEINEVDRVGMAQLLAELV